MVLRSQGLPRSTERGWLVLMRPSCRYPSVSLLGGAGLGRHAICTQLLETGRVLPLLASSSKRAGRAGCLPARGCLSTGLSAEAGRVTGIPFSSGFIFLPWSGSFILPVFRLCSCLCRHVIPFRNYSESLGTWFRHCKYYQGAKEWEFRHSGRESVTLLFSFIGS